MSKINVDEAAREITGMSMDQVFERSEQAVRRAAELGALDAIKEDVKEAHGVTLADEVLYHAVVCGFSLSLVMAQQSAARYLDEQRGA